MQQDNQQTVSETPHTSRLSRGWQLTKSAWYLLRLNKRLIVLPLVSLAIGVICMWFMFFGFLMMSFAVLDTKGYIGIGASIVGLYVFISLVASFCNAALIYGVTKSFSSEKATIKQSLKGAFAKWKPLVLFTLLSSTIGLLLQAIEDRLPFAGSLTAWLFGAAWSVATIFALPVIVLSPQMVRPIAATKQSVKIVKQTWGEGLVAGLGLGVISVVATVLFMVVGIGAIFIAQMGSQALLWPIIIAMIVGLLLFTLVFGALNSIAQAAFYHYATTHEAPAMFNKALIQSAMTKNKARAIFS